MSHKRNNIADTGTGSDTFDKWLTYLIIIIIGVLTIAMFTWAIWFKYHEDRNLEWNCAHNFAYSLLMLK